MVFFLNFTPSQITGSKYSISVIAHWSHIRRKISIEDKDDDISNNDSIDVRCRVLFKTKNMIIINNTIPSNKY